MSDFTFVPNEDDSRIYEFLRENHLLPRQNKWGLNFKQGLFFRYSNLIFDSLQLAKVTLAEYKAFNWVYRNTVGFRNANVVFENQRFIAKEELNLSKQGMIDGFEGCREKLMLYFYEDEIIRSREKKKCVMVRINPFPDLWIGVGNKIEGVIDRYIKNAQKRIKKR